MVWSDTTNNQGLVQDIDFLCTTSSVTYPLNDKARSANRHVYAAVVDILKSSGRVQFDDSNHTTLPEYTFTLVNGQKDYSLPTNLLKLWAIEVTDSAGNKTRLQEIDINDLRHTITDFEETAGIPRFYDIRGDSVFLHPAPATSSVTLVDGGKMYFAREIDAFTGSDTTQEPGFAEPFHRIVSLGAAYDYLLINGPTDRMDRVYREYAILRSQLRDFYSSKNEDVKIRIRPASKSLDYA